MRLIRKSLAATAAFPLLLAFSVEAYAGERQASPTPAGQHCVNRLARVSASGPEAAIVSSTCFATFAESFRHLTRGRVTVPADLRPEQVTQAMVDAAPASVVVLSTDWNGSNYSGGGLGFSSVNWEASSSCTASQAWALTYIGDYYNDKIGSSKTYGGCHKGHHYEHGGYGGAVLTCTPNCSSMGVMDNQTSSLKWGW